MQRGGHDYVADSCFAATFVPLGLAALFFAFLQHMGVRDGAAGVWAGILLVYLYVKAAKQLPQDIEDADYRGYAAERDRRERLKERYDRERRDR